MHYDPPKHQQLSTGWQKKLLQKTESSREEDQDFESASSVTLEC